MGSMGEEEVTRGGGGEEGKEKEEANLFKSPSPSRSLSHLGIVTLSGDFSGALSQLLQVNADLAKRDPWLLPSSPFITTKKSSNLQTHSEETTEDKAITFADLWPNPWTYSGGSWKEKGNKLTAVRYQGKGSGSPSYLGIKTTKVFCDKYGNETEWFEHEYQLLDAHKNKPGLVLQEDLVCRKVFRNCSHGDEARHLSKKSRVARCQRVLAERKLNQADLQSGEEPSGSRDCLHACAPHNGETEDLREGGSSSRPAAPRNKESDVWQHFTKIYTKDPEVVHAVCHGCDKVFNAHSKIDGTSHLRRHRLACSGHSPCWSAEDQKILQDLRQAHDLYQQEKMEIDADLTKLDPLDPLSSSGYVTSSTTHQGCWKEIRKWRTAIRTDQFPVSPPRYGGMKRALQSQGQDGNKMAYIMIEIQLVDDYNPPCLFLQGAVVFRKVFQNLKDMISDSFSELDKCLNAEDDDEEYYNDVHEDEVQAYTTTLQDCLVSEVDQSRSGKRKRTSAPHGGSDVWLNFTRIYTSDPNRVYAVCHFCDICYNGHPKNGTSHLKRHNEKCSSKHRELPRHNDTGSANVTDPVWEADIWPFIAQLLENYDGTGEEIRTEAEVGNNQGDLGGWH
ncbi:hypothetical protein BS78_08G117700 [Paspalum vaginatum]|nr:hypothetical protein BS78_08G117700 [Paspalum vaginatum]